MEIFLAENLRIAGEMNIADLVQTKGNIRKRVTKQDSRTEDMVDQAQRTMTVRTTGYNGDVSTNNLDNTKLQSVMVPINPDTVQAIKNMASSSAVVQSALGFVVKAVFASSRIVILEPGSTKKEATDESSKSKGKQPLPTDGDDDETPPYMKSQLFQASALNGVDEVTNDDVNRMEDVELGDSQQDVQIREAASHQHLPINEREPLANGEHAEDIDQQMVNVQDAKRKKASKKSASSKSSSSSDSSSSSQSSSSNSSSRSSSSSKSSSSSSSSSSQMYLDDFDLDELDELSTKRPRSEMDEDSMANYKPKLPASDLDLDTMIDLLEHPDETREELNRILGYLGECFVQQYMMYGIVVIAVPISNAQDVKVIPVDQMDITFVDHVDGERSYFASRKGIVNAEDAAHEEMYFIAVKNPPDLEGDLTSMAYSLLPAYSTLEVKESLAQASLIRSLIPEIVCSIIPAKPDPNNVAIGDVATLGSAGVLRMNQAIADSVGTGPPGPLQEKEEAVAKQRALQIATERELLMKNMTKALAFNGKAGSIRSALNAAMASQIFQTDRVRLMPAGYKYDTAIQPLAVDVDEERQQFCRTVANLFMIPPEFLGSEVANVAVQAESSAHALQLSLSFYCKLAESFLTWIVNCRYRSTKQELLKRRKNATKNIEKYKPVPPQTKPGMRSTLMGVDFPLTSTGLAAFGGPEVQGDVVPTGANDKSDEELRRLMEEERSKVPIKFDADVLTRHPSKNSVQVKILMLPSLSSLTAVSAIGQLEPKTVKLIISMLLNIPPSYVAEQAVDPTLTQKAMLDAGLDTIKTKNSTEAELAKMKEAKRLGLGPNGKPKPKPKAKAKAKGKPKAKSKPKA